MGPLRDLAPLGAADFQAVAGSPFRVSVGPSLTLELRLVEVVDLGQRPGERPSQRPSQRPPFVLRFQGPPEPVLEQVVHRLEHTEMGDLDIFLGPVSNDAEVTMYEAVFG
jgi:hypothetical protein